MDMLPLVPVVLLGVVSVWLIWPVIVDPLTRHARTSKRKLPETADSLADGLFGAWLEESEPVGRIDIYQGR